MNHTGHMDEEKVKKIKAKLKKRLPLFVFLALSTTTFFFASSLFLDEAYKDVILIVMIWALPLFIH